jgi:hypothetical protein
MTQDERRAFQADPDFQALPRDEQMRFLREYRAGQWQRAPEPSAEPPGLGTRLGGWFTGAPAPPPTAAPPTEIPAPATGAEAFFAGEPTRPPTLAESEAVPGLLKAPIQAALPTMGQIGGAAVGGPLGAAAGGAIGEIASQALGISEPSATQIGLATAGGAITKPLTVLGRVPGAAKRVVERVPPIWEWGRGRLGREVAETVAGKIKPQEAVEAAYGEARELARKAPMLPFTRTKTALSEWAERQAPGPEFPGIERVTRRAMERVGTLLDRPEASFQDVVNVFDQVGVQVAKYGKKPGSGQLRHLYGELVSDLEAAAPTHPAADKLREAANVFKQRRAMLDLDKAVTAALDKGPGRAAHDILRKGLDKVKADLPADVYESLHDTVARFGRYPDRPLSEWTGMLGVAGYGFGGPLGLAVTAPVIGKELMRAEVHPATATLLAAGYQGARRLGAEMTRATGE